MRAHTVCLFVAIAAVLTPTRASTNETGRVSEGLYRSPIEILFDRAGEFAYVVNHTSDSVSILDRNKRTVVGEIEVGPRPTGAALSPDGNMLYVTCRYGNRVDAVDLAERRVLRAIRTGIEPIGVTLSPDGKKIYVANAVDGSLSILDVSTGALLHEVETGNTPFYVATIPPEGNRLIVGHGLARHAAIVDTKTGRVIERRELGRASLMRGVACTSDGKWGIVANLITRDDVVTLQMDRGWICSNGITFFDLRDPGHFVALPLDRLLKGAANPHSLALSSDDRRLYVTLAGIHEVAIVDVEKALELVRETAPEEVLRLSQDVEIAERRGIARRVDSGGIGPRGLALDEPRGEVWIANYYSDTVTILDAESGDVIDAIPLGPQQEMTLWRKGSMLANDARLCFENWYSCCSCHQEESTMDALSWDLANDGLGNPKNAKSLHDAYDTAPSMWRGVRADMDAAVKAGQRFLGFLPEPENDKALFAYFSDPPRAPNPYRGRNPEATARGEAIFYKARCHACHPAPKYTDQIKHDVGLANESDLKSRFDTSTLRDIYRTGPYLHDGRAETLKDIFVTHNPNNYHGLTGGLSNEEIDDLVEFLRTL